MGVILNRKGDRMASEAEIIDAYRRGDIEGVRRILAREENIAPENLWFPYPVGTLVAVIGIPYHYAGRVTIITPEWVELSESGWIATGPEWHKFETEEWVTDTHLQYELNPFKEIRILKHNVQSVSRITSLPVKSS